MGVTATDLSIHDLERVGSSSSSDFALKNNTADSFDLCCMYNLVDPSKYRMKIIPCVVLCLSTSYLFLYLTV